MSSKLIWHQNSNVPKTEMSSKLKYCQNWQVSKTLKSPKIRCYQNWKVTKTEISPKHKCHQNWNFTKTWLYNWTLKFYSRILALIVLPLFQCFSNWKTFKAANCCHTFGSYLIFSCLTGGQWKAIMGEIYHFTFSV